MTVAKRVAKKVGTFHQLRSQMNAFMHLSYMNCAVFDNCWVLILKWKWMPMPKRNINKNTYVLILPANAHHEPLFNSVYLSWARAFVVVVCADYKLYIMMRDAFSCCWNCYLFWLTCQISANVSEIEWMAVANSAAPIRWHSPGQQRLLVISVTCEGRKMLW